MVWGNLKDWNDIPMYERSLLIVEVTALGRFDDHSNIVGTTTLRAGIIMAQKVDVDGHVLVWA